MRRSRTAHDNRDVVFVVVPARRRALHSGDHLAHLATPRGLVAPLGLAPQRDALRRACVLGVLILAAAELIFFARHTRLWVRL